MKLHHYDPWPRAGPDIGPRLLSIQELGHDGSSVKTRWKMLEVQPGKIMTMRLHCIITKTQLQDSDISFKDILLKQSLAITLVSLGLLCQSIFIVLVLMKSSRLSCLICMIWECVRVWGSNQDSGVTSSGHCAAPGASYNSVMSGLTNYSTNTAYFCPGQGQNQDNKSYSVILMPWFSHCWVGIFSFIFLDIMFCFGPMSHETEKQT